MSENLDVVRSIFAAWERGEWSSADWADPEIEYVIADGPQPGMWKGLSELAEAFRDFLGGLEEYRLEAQEYRELDNGRVVVFVHGHGRGKTSGLDLGQLGGDGAALFRICDGKVTRVAFFWDREDALANLGLEE